MIQAPKPSNNDNLLNEIVSFVSAEGGGEVVFVCRGAIKCFTLSRVVFWFSVTVYFSLSLSLSLSLYLSISTSFFSIYRSLQTTNVRDTPGKGNASAFRHIRVRFADLREFIKSADARVVSFAHKMLRKYPSTRVSMNNKHRFKRQTILPYCISFVLRMVVVVLSFGRCYTLDSIDTTEPRDDSTGYRFELLF